jgi:hypothetical protein
MHWKDKEILFLKSPFLPSVFFSTSSLLVICWSSSGRFSTTESPLMDRILAKVAAALQHRVAAADEVETAAFEQFSVSCQLTIPKHVA